MDPKNIPQTRSQEVVGCLAVIHEPKPSSKLLPDFRPLGALEDQGLLVSLSHGCHSDIGNPSLIWIVDMVNIPVFTTGFVHPRWCLPDFFLNHRFFFSNSQTQETQAHFSSRFSLTFNQRKKMKSARCPLLVFEIHWLPRYPFGKKGFPLLSCITRVTE